MNGKILNKEALKAWILSKVVTLTNNLLATTPGVSAMDAAQGPVIQGQIDAINSNLKGFEPVLDDSGKITGYKTDLGGADTVFPFSQMSNIELLYAGHYGNSIYGSTYTYTFKKDYPLVICFNVSAGNNPVSGSIGATLKTGTCKNLASYANPSSETRGLNTACAKIVDAKSNDGITLHAIQLSYGLIVAIG